MNNVMSYTIRLMIFLPLHIETNDGGRKYHNGL